MVIDHWDARSITLTHCLHHNCWYCICYTELAQSSVHRLRTLVWTSTFLVNFWFLKNTWNFHRKWTNKYWFIDIGMFCRKVHDGFLQKVELKSWKKSSKKPQNGIKSHCHRIMKNSWSFLQKKIRADHSLIYFGRNTFEQHYFWWLHGTHWCFSTWQSLFILEKWVAIFTWQR